jgi:hypothetical protein
LRGLNAPLDFCNEEGHVLGHFEPYPKGIKPSDLEPDISEDEFRRRIDNFRGRPLAELIAEWEKRK